MYKYLTEQEHTESFIAGNIYFTNLSHYILTEDITRKDIEEGYFDLNQDVVAKADSFFGEKIETNKKFAKMSDLIKPIDQPQNFFVLCMSLSDSNYKLFGSNYRVGITDVKEFSRRVTKALQYFDLGEGCLAQEKVEYYEKKDHKKKFISNGAYPLYKRDKYKNEEEYRFYIINQNPYEEFPIKNTPHSITALFYKIKLFIGDISDICTIEVDE